MPSGLFPFGISTRSGPQSWLGVDNLTGQETLSNFRVPGRPISDFTAKGVEGVLVQGCLCQKGKTDGSLSESGFYKRS